MTYDAEEKRGQQLTNNEEYEQTEQINRKFSKLASRCRATIRISRRVTLGLVFTGACLQTLSTQIKQPQYGSTLSLLASACIGAAPFLTYQFLSSDKIANWVNNG
mmetsp:Transcript_26534/g.32731  ORF Transcript_26534/g.32731 Transcript_26534/m.32731 type:complete len:105 (+) Transcript_26534:108-422(+)